MVGSGRVWRRWGGAVDGFLFEGHVGVEVDPGCFDAFVSEPEGDCGDVDAGVEETHGCGVGCCRVPDAAEAQASAWHAEAAEPRRGVGVGPSVEPELRLG